MGKLVHPLYLRQFVLFHFRSSDELVNQDAPVFHVVPYITGGLQRLYHLLKTDTVPELLGKLYIVIAYL